MSVSSLTDPVLDQLVDLALWETELVAEPVEVESALLRRLAQVPDRRARCGLRHPNALLHIACLVHDQHRLLVVQVLDDVLADIVTDGVGIPGGPAQQMLHAVRIRFPGPLRDRPAVLARQVREQAQHRPARRRGSTRANRLAMRPMATSNASRQRAGPGHHCL